jgi:hypothetical protein
VSLDTDNVFSEDQAVLQLATVTLAAEGDVATSVAADATEGYVATLTVAV